MKAVPIEYTWFLCVENVWKLSQGSKNNHQMIVGDKFLNQHLRCFKICEFLSEHRCLRKRVERCLLVNITGTTACTSKLVNYTRS